MRVAVVDPLSSTPPYDHHLCHALSRRGHDVHLLTSRFLYGALPPGEGFERDEVWFPISTRLFASRPRSPLKAPVRAAEYLPSALRCLRRLDALDPDVVHMQWFPLPRLDVHWASRVARRWPLVLTAHDVIPRRTSHQHSLWRQLFGLCRAVVVHSDRAVEQLVDFGVDRRKLVRIMHPAFVPEIGEPQPPRGSTMLFFGLLRHYKGLDLLIEALPAVLRKVPHARLLVAGDPLEPVEGVRARARELGVDEAIEWRLGFIPEDQVAGLMREAAFLVLPYRELDSSGVLAVGIGYGRPAVVSDVGSLGEIVREFECGVSIAPSSVEALADACVRLLAEPGEIERLARNTSKAREALSWAASATAHENVYQRALSRV